MSQYYLHTYHHKAVEVLTPSGSVAKGALHGRQFNIALASCKSASLLEGNNANWMPIMIAKPTAPSLYNRSPSTVVEI